MLRPVLVSPPAAPPVSLAEAKAHCRVDFADDDALITSLIDAATTHLDGWTGILGRAVVTQTWRQDFCAFGSRMRLPVGPVASVDSVKYFDADNAEETVDPSVFIAATDAMGSYVELAAGKSWPATYDRPDAVGITYVAGADAADVPSALKAAILLHIAHLYLNREAVVLGESPTILPMAAAALVAPYRRIGV